MKKTLLIILPLLLIVGCEKEETEMMKIYAKAVYGDEEASKTLIRYYISKMEKDKQKINLAKLCWKYDVSLACDELKKINASE